jgi:hypothetical protein
MTMFFKHRLMLLLANKHSLLSTSGYLFYKLCKWYLWVFSTYRSFCASCNQPKLSWYLTLFLQLFFYINFSYSLSIPLPPFPRQYSGIYQDWLRKTTENLTTATSSSKIQTGYLLYKSLQCYWYTAVKKHRKHPSFQTGTVGKRSLQASIKIHTS